MIGSPIGELIPGVSCKSTPLVGTNITSKFNASLIRLGVDCKFW